MQFVTLTLRDTQLPVIVNLANVDYIQSAGGNGSNLHFSRETIYVVESPAEIEALANPAKSDHDNTYSVGGAVHTYRVFGDGGVAAAITTTDESTQGAAPVADQPADEPPTDEPPAKPGSKRETK